MAEDDDDSGVRKLKDPLRKLSINQLLINNKFEILLRFVLNALNMAARLRLWWYRYIK